MTMPKTPTPTPAPPAEPTAPAERHIVAVSVDYAARFARIVTRQEGARAPEYHDYTGEGFDEFVRRCPDLAQSAGLQLTAATGGGL